MGGVSSGSRAALIAFSDPPVPSASRARRGRGGGGAGGGGGGGTVSACIVTWTKAGPCEMLGWTRLQAARFAGRFFTP